MNNWALTENEADWENRFSESMYLSQTWLIQYLKTSPPSSYVYVEGSHLVFTGPEGADGQLHLVPLVSLGAWDIPHRAALRAPVDPDVDLQVPGAVAVAAVQEVAELDAVGVVLAERQQQELGPLAPVMLGGVDHHEGPCRGRTQSQKASEESL